MTQDEIIEMARQAGFLRHEDSLYTNHRYGDCKLELEAFAKLIAAKEWIVESKYWYNFKWKYQNLFSGDDAYDRAHFYARALKYTHIEEVK